VIYLLKTLLLIDSLFEKKVWSSTGILLWATPGLRGERGKGLITQVYLDEAKTQNKTVTYSSSAVCKTPQLNGTDTLHLLETHTQSLDFSLFVISVFSNTYP